MYGEETRSSVKEPQKPAPRFELSVAIISNNDGKTIESCIRSVLDATRDLQAEVMLVDSRSEDSTLAIVGKFGIRVISLPADVSSSTASGRSVGARNCRGRYIQFVDGDMTIEPMWIRRALSYFETADASTAAVAGELSQNPTRTAAREYQRRNLAKMTRTQEAKELDSLYGAFMIKASVLEKLGSFNPQLKLLAEADLSDRIRATGYRIILLPHLMCHHHVSEGEGFARGMKHTWTAAIAGGEIFRKATGTGSFLFRLRQFKSSFAAAAFVLYGLASLISAISFRSPWLGLSWCLALLLLFALLVIREKGRPGHALYFLALFLTTWVFFFYGFFLMPYEKCKHVDSEPAESPRHGR